MTAVKFKIINEVLIQQARKTNKELKPKNKKQVIKEEKSYVISEYIANTIKQYVHKELRPLIEAEFINAYKIEAGLVTISFTSKCKLYIYPCNKMTRYLYKDGNNKVLFDETVTDEKQNN